MLSLSAFTAYKVLCCLERFLSNVQITLIVSIQQIINVLHYLVKLFGPDSIGIIRGGKCINYSKGQ